MIDTATFARMLGQAMGIVIAVILLLAAGAWYLHKDD